MGTLQFVIPALWQMSGASVSEQPMPLTIKAKLISDIRKSPGRKDFQRGILSRDEKGLLSSRVLPRQQSHRIKQLSRANCFIVLDKDSGNVAAGHDVVVQPFPSWLHR